MSAVLQDQLLRLLEGSPNGMTVERLRSHLQAGGSRSRKDEIAVGLRALSERGIVEIGAARKWRIRRRDAARGSGPQGSREAEATETITAVRCSAFLGDHLAPEDPLPPGRLAPDPSLFARLLPYYQEALRAGDGGAPIDGLEGHGARFVFLQPDTPWWPIETGGRVLRVPRPYLPAEFQSMLAKSSSSKLLLGYPVHVITPRGDDAQPFFRPVSTFRCDYNLAETHLEVRVPALPPAIVQDWIRDQRTYGGWTSTRLRSWLLLEDEDGDVRDEDDFAPMDFVVIPAFAGRLAAAVGRDVRQALDPSAIASQVPAKPKTGYYNALVLMPDVRGKYTRSAIHDYDALRACDPASLGATSLTALFGSQGRTMSAPVIIHPFPLSESQLVAARSGLTGPLTVITGPPGTGKSQVIAAMMLSAAAAGRSVLFAARQHRAIDAVRERLEYLAGDRSLLIRANEAEGFGGFTFTEALKGLRTRSGDAAGAEAFARAYARLADIDGRRWALLQRWRDLKHATDEAARLQAEIERLQRQLKQATTAATDDGPNRLGTLANIRKALLAFLKQVFSGRLGSLAVGRNRLQAHLQSELARTRQDLAAMERRIRETRNGLNSEPEDPVSLSDTIARESVDAVPALLDRLDCVSNEDRQALVAITGDTALSGVRSVPPEAYRLILAHLPLWAVTTLAAGSRIPIEPGLFDYVIFDEAAQTDIASAIPLLYRAKVAVVVGDPMQLAMISNLDPREERDLLRRHDLFRGGIGRFAQGQTTLFDLASTCLSEAPILLSDHYRCHPQIAAYFSEAFYGRRLTAVTDVARLKVPRGFRAGLHWTPVSGPIVARSGGRQSGSAASEAEARAIVEHLQQLVARGFEGTIGIVTFFDYQAKTIGEMANRILGAKTLDKHAVKIFTAHKFQGDERDVILLSLCLGPTMPAGARTFLQKEKRLLNVAVSRARAICHIFGDIDFASRSGIPHIEALARTVRQSSQPREVTGGDRFESPWEERLFQALLERGYSPIPQHPVVGRFLDLALVDERRTPPKYIDIEVDGVRFHTDVDGNRLITDLWRDHQLRALGWRVLRFWVPDLRDNMEVCLEQIDAEYRS